MSDAHGPEDRFEEAWREWATRPPRLTPEEAGRAVADAVHQDAARRRSAWPALALAATIVVALAIAVIWRVSASIEPASSKVLVTANQVGDGVVLMWLDEETPLYMTFQVPETAGGTGGSTP